MLPQDNYGGYQPTEAEQEESNLIADLLLGTGLGAAGTAGGIGLEIERRKRRGKQGYGEAATELKTDAETALRVLLGRSAYDKGNIESVLQNIEVGGTSNPEDGYRSIRNYAESSSDDSFYNVKGQSSGGFANTVNQKSYPTSGANTPGYGTNTGNTNTSNSNKFNSPPPTGTTTNSYRSAGSSYEKNPFTQAAVAARDAFNASSEDFLSTERAFRTTRGMTAEGPRSDTAFSRIPLVDAYRDLLSGKKIPGTNVGYPWTYNDDHYSFREKENMNLLSRNAAQTAGSFMGRAASDFTNNGVRSLWWLLNAPQAVADVVSEGATGGSNRYGLYGNDIVSYDEALKNNWINAEGEALNPSVAQVSEKTKDPYLQQKIRDVKGSVPAPTKGDTKPRRDRVYARRRTGNNYSTLLALPAAIGINAGLGLNNPLGGSDGYKAASPSEDDPTRTDNVLAEIGIKYVLGRRGDILPWEEFKKVRPDVSKEEYGAYKGYKFSKGWDLNPFDDGDFNVGGILKGTDDGLYGGEVMFLGKHMPTETVLAPAAAAIAGSALGAALGKYGGMNQAGIDEAVDRNRAQRNSVLLSIGQDEDSEVIDSATNKLRADIETPGMTTKERDEISRKLTGLDSKLEGLDKRSAFIDNIADNDFTIRGKDVVDSTTGKARRPDRDELRMQRRDRWRKRNPVALGTALGLGTLGVSSIIGNESERRRREENLRSQQGI